jgi:hypothetical protein
VNHLDGHTRTCHIFRERGLPHATLDKLHGTVPDKGSHALFVMFREPEMMQSKIHRHGKVTERIEQSPVQVKNNEGFLFEHSAPKCRNLPNEFHLDEEPVKAKRRHSQNKHDNNNKLHRMFVKIIICLAVRELSTDNGADKKSKK